jgi:ribosomal protein S18 acetylase RimI-like enzyme
MKLMIRACERDDFQGILNLLKQLWPDLQMDNNAIKMVYNNARSSTNQKLIVGIMDNRIVGFCSLTIKNNLKQAGNLGNVDELVVDVKYRQRGIGKMLMDAITQVAMENSCNRIELDSSFHRHEAHKFYERIGFKCRAYLFTKEL